MRPLSSLEHDRRLEDAPWDVDSSPGRDEPLEVSRRNAYSVVRAVRAVPLVMSAGPSCGTCYPPSSPMKALTSKDYLSLKELRRFLRNCLSARDRAIVLLGYRHGLRPAEVAL